MSKPATSPNQITIPIDATLSNVLGALKQDAADLAQYLHQTAPPNVDTVECRRHLQHMMTLMGQLHNVQVMVQTTMAAGDQPSAERRKN